MRGLTPELAGNAVPTIITPGEWNRSSIPAPTVLADMIVAGRCLHLDAQLLDQEKDQERVVAA